MSYKLYDAEIEYLESTGTQGIDTLVNFRELVTAEIKMSISKSITANSALFGAYTDVASVPRCQYYITNGQKWATISTANKVSISGVTQNTNVVVGQIYTIRISSTATQASNMNALLFRRNNDKNSYLPIDGMRLYSTKITIGTTLVRDFIPVRVGNVGYLFDKVSMKLFGNSGTGSFVLGPDVAPAAYANEIAFLESTGSQYIDTGYVPNSNTVIDASVAGLEVGCVPFGVRWTGTPTYDTVGLYFASSSPNMVVYWGNYRNNEFTKVDKPLQKKIGVKIGLTQIDIDGNQYPITRGSISNTYSLYLFGMNNMGEAASLLSSRIYNFKIIENNTTLFDFIPVEYNNIGYLYDKVSGEFFANQGTGKFVLGHRAPRFDGKACARSYTRRQLMADTVLPKPYISDGLVFHLDGADATSTNWVDRVAGMVYALDGATPNNEGTGVNFNISNNSCVATLVGSAPSSVSSVRGKTGTIEICMYRRALRTNYLEYIFQTNRYSIAYLTDAGSSNIVFTGTSNGENYKAPRGLLPNGRELGFITHSYNAVTTCYKGKEVAVGANTYKTAYEWTIGNNTSKGAPFKGTIYQIRIYNRQLSLDEMKFNQEQDRKRYGI